MSNPRAALTTCCILWIGLILCNLRISILNSRGKARMSEFGGNQSCPLCNFCLGEAAVPEEGVHAGIAWSRLELSSRWHCAMSLPCLAAGRNKEPLGVPWPGKVLWPSLIWAALMPASFCGLPQNKRCNVICFEFSSMETLVFSCL